MIDDAQSILSAHLSCSVCGFLGYVIYGRLFGCGAQTLVFSTDLISTRCVIPAVPTFGMDVERDRVVAGGAQVLCVFRPLRHSGGSPLHDGRHP